MTARIRRAAAAVAVGLTLLAWPVDRAAAQGVPVYDATSVAQLIEQVTHQLEQLATMKAQLESLTGARGIGAFMNAPEDIAARAAATNLTGLVDGAITGSPILGNTARLAATIERLKGNYQLDLLGPYASSDIVQYRALANLGGSSLAAMATGEDSYLRANDAMDRVNRLVPQIDANTDMKAAIDFNTRVQIEQIQVMNELLRVLSAQANATGAQALFITREQMASREFLKFNAATGGAGE
jgi:type IV secretion system protein VirB5